MHINLSMGTNILIHFVSIVELFTNTQSWTTRISAFESPQRHGLAPTKGSTTDSHVHMAPSANQCCLRGCYQKFGRHRQSMRNTTNPRLK